MPFLRREPDLKRLLAQRSAELKLCESKFRNIIDKTSEGIVITDLSGEVLFVNGTAETMLERKAQDLVGGRLPFPSLPGTPRQFDLQKKGGKRTSLEANFVSTQWDGKQAYIGCLRDVTAQRKNEGEYKKLYRAVLESPSMVMITDVNATIEFVNPKFTEITGYTAAEVIGKTPRIIKSGMMAEQFYREMWDTIKSGREWRGEIINRRKNGDFYWERSSISPVKDLQGSITHYVAVTEDITEHKRREEEFRKINRALKTLSEANSAVITATDEGKLLYDICRIIVDHGGYVMAWVGYKGYDEEKRIRPVAEWNIDRHFLEAMEISWDENHHRGRGPTGTATRTGVTHIIQNVSEDPTYIPWREQAQRQGYGSMVAVALKGESEPFGVLCIFAHETDAFQPEEVDLLTKLAENLAFGVRSLRIRQERKRIERELKATFDQAAVGIAHVSPDGRWLRVNDQLCSIVGYSHSEMLKLNFQDITHPDDLKSELELAQQLTEGIISTYSLEKRYIRKDGQIIWVSLTVSLMQKEDGTPDYFISVIENITARKDAEEQLRKSKDNLRVIFNSVYDAIFIHDLNGNIIDLNDKMLEMYGVDREHGVKLSIINDYSGPDAPVGQLSEIWGRVLAGERLLVDWQARRPSDGSLFWVEVFLRRVTLTEQDVILANVHDISERKQTEQRVKESEYRLAEAQRMAHVGSWELDLSRQTALWSAELYRIFGLPIGTLVTHEEFLNRVHIDDRDLLRQAEDEAIRARGSFSCHFRIRRPDESVRILLGKGEVVVDESGIPIKMIGTDQDVTEIRRAEEAIRESEEQVRLLLDSTAEGIVGIDTEGKCFLSNKSAVFSFGLDSQLDLLGKRLHEMVHHHYPDGSVYPVENCKIIAAARKGEEIHVEGELFWRRDGSGFPIEYWAHPMRRGDRFLGAVVTFIDISARKESERKLRESERRLAEAQRIAHLGSWEWDVASDAVVWSEELYRMFGVPMGTSPVPDLFIQLVRPEDRRRIEEKTREVIENPKPFADYYRIIRPDGTERIIFTQGDVISEEAGRLKIIATNQDVTELKQAEEAVRESQEKFSKAFRIAPVILAISRVSDGIYLEVNEAYERAFGYRRDEVVGRSSFELGVWADPDDRLKMIQILRGKEKFNNYEVTFKQKSGSLFFVLLSADLIELRGEECLLSIGMDITQRKVSEQQLMQLSNRLSAILESISDGFFSLDRQWRITYVNRNAEGPLGRKREELLGNNLWEVFPEAAKRRFYSEYKKVMDERHPVEFVEYYEPYDIWFEARAFPTEEGLAVYFRDVTARKKQEEEFERMNRELENRAAKLERANVRLEAYKTAISSECLRHLAVMHEICKKTLKVEVLPRLEKNDIELICDNVLHMIRLIQGLEDRGT